ncbi:MAG: hypothetical protein ACRD3O_10820 [Terriglobia bacterium]
MDSAEIKRLAAEVSVQHGIRIDPDDPMMAVVTLNRLMLERAFSEAAVSIRNIVEDFNRAAERVQIRAGSVIAQEVREAVAAIRMELQKNIDGAHVKASKPNGTACLLFRFWSWMLLSGAALFAAGLWVGTFVR